MIDRKLVASGALALALMSAAYPAHAAWWNPFQPRNEAGEPDGRDAYQPQPPSSVGEAPASRGFSAPPQNRSAQASDGGVAVQLNRVEEQVRTLTGQVEEMGFIIRRLQEQVRRLESSAGVAQTPTQPLPQQQSMPPQERQRSEAAPPLPLDGSSLSARIRDEAPPAARIPPGASAGPGAPPRNLGTIPGNIPGSGQQVAPGQSQGQAPAANGAPLNLTALGREPATATDARPAPAGAGPAALVDPRQDYDNGYRQVLAGNYETAETTFRTFLARYPNDKLTPDAQYWLGESLFQRRQYREAADAFLAGYKADPKAEKAPDTLLKLGLSLNRLGARKEACSTYSELLKSYPKINNALRQRVQAEQASAEC